MAKSNKIRIKLKAYDHKILDASSLKIIEAAKATGAKVVGPVPLPTEKQVYTILRAVHKYKDSREQFEMRTHKRLIDIVNPTAKTVDTLTRLDLPTPDDPRKTEVFPLEMYGRISFIPSPVTELIANTRAPIEYLLAVRIYSSALSTRSDFVSKIIGFAPDCQAMVRYLSSRLILKSWFSDWIIKT